MTCEHLHELEQALIAAGLRETYRGQPWSRNCREWVYFDCFLDLPQIRNHFTFDSCIQDHVHRGTHDGQETGLVCSIHHDALMGAHEAYRQPTTPVFGG